MKLRRFARLRFFHRCRLAVMKRARQLHDRFLKRVNAGHSIPQWWGVESLEARIAPATIVVTTLNDKFASDGTVSLPEAINAMTVGHNVSDVVASGAYGTNDLIVFSPALAGGTIHLTPTFNFDTGANANDFGPTAFKITTSLTIDGGSGITLVRDAGSAPFRLFTIAQAGNLTIDHMTLAGGFAVGGNGGSSAQGGGGGAGGFGGAIANFGSLTIEHSLLLNNEALGGNAGGTNAASGGGAGGGGVAGPGNDSANLNVGYGGGGPNGGNGGIGSGNSGGFGGGGAGGSNVVITSNGFSGGDGGFGGGGGGGGVGSGSGRHGGTGGDGGFGAGGGGGGGGVSSATTGTAGGTVFGGGAGTGKTGGGGAGMGGAIFNDGGTINIVDSTFAGNSAVGGNGAHGGGAYGGAIFNLDGLISLNNDTIANNTVTAGTGGTGVVADGGGLYNLTQHGTGLPAGTATVNIFNTILAYSSVGSKDLVNASGSVVGNHNISQTNSGLGAGVIISTADPLLNPLGNYGGPTQTMPPKAASVAIDGGTNANAPSDDQRGFTRPASVISDIGAVEIQNSLTLSASGGTYDVLLSGGNVIVKNDQTGDILFSENQNSMKNLVITGGAGNDTLQVDSVNGLVALPGGIQYSGGGGFDTLNLIQTGGTAQTTDLYQVGPGVGQGTSTITGPSGVQTVFFDGLAPVVDLVPVATLTVNGTAADNAINYGLSANPTRGLVRIDNFESIDFSNKGQLVINGGPGNDVINLNNPNVPTGLTFILVTGGDPNTDTLVVNGTATVSDRFIVGPTAAGAGLIADLSPLGTLQGVTIGYNGMENISIVGQQADGDSLADVGTAGDDVFTVDFGDPFSGKLSGYSIGGAGFTFTPISFSGIGGFVAPASGMFNLTALAAPASGGGGGHDTVVINGTAGDDIFNTPNSLHVPEIQMISGNVPSVFVALAGDQISGFATHVIVKGLGGNDTFNYSPQGAFGPADYRFEGNDAAGATNTINYTSPAGVTTTIDAAGSSITAAGQAPFTFTGVQHIVENANASTLIVDGSTGADNFNFTPGAPGAGSLLANSLSIDFNGATSFQIAGLGGGDTLFVNGTTGADTFTATDTQVTIAGLQAVAFLGIATVNLNGGDGSDSFTVTPSANVAFNVDGGNPIGAGDSLTVITGANSVTYNAGPLSDQGSFSVGANLPVSFTHIESATAAGSGGGGGLTITGTNAPDVITVVGTGTNAFTVSVNDGPTVAYSSIANFSINSLAGNDEIDITPFYGAGGWQETVNVDGGQPVGTDSGDHLLVAGSNGNETVGYFPGAGVLTVNGGAATGTLFNLSNLELLDYNGGGGIASFDTVTVTSPAGLDFVTVTEGSHVDSGIVTVQGFLPLGFAAIGAAGALNLLNAGGLGDFLDYVGTDSTDQYVLQAGGDIPLNNQIAVNADPASFIFVNLDAGANQAQLFMPGSINPYPGLIAGNTGLVVTGNAQSTATITTGAGFGPSFTVNAQTGTLTGFGISSIGLPQLAQLTIQGGGVANESYQVTGLGSGDKFAAINITGGATTSLAFSGTSGVDTLALSAGNNVTALAVDGSSLGSLHYATIGGTVTYNSGTAGDVLEILGTASNDTITLVGDASGVPNHFAGLRLDTDHQVLLGSAVRILVNGNAGNDTLTVDSSTAPFTNPITYDGGLGTDTLVLSGGTATSDTYTAGPAVGQGTMALTFAAGNENIAFSNLEPVLDTIVSPLLTVNGSAANNTVNYTQGSSATNGLVTIDNFESIEFSNKTSLTLNGGGGTDSFALSNPNVPTGLTGITVNGDANNRSSLTISGHIGTTDHYDYIPTGAGAGSMVELGAAFAPLAFTGMSSLTINGQAADGDSLAEPGTTGNDAFTVDWGLDPNSGSISGFSTGASGFAFVPVNFSGISGYLAPATGLLQLTTNVLNSNITGVGGVDTVTIDGTTGDDAFSFVTTMAAPEVVVTSGATAHVPVALFANAGQGQTLHAAFHGLSGNDTFNFALAALPTNGPADYTVQGNDAGGFSNTLSYTSGAGAATSINLGPGTITSGALPTVTFTAIQHITEISSGAGSLTINGTAIADSLAYTPINGNAGTVTDGNFEPRIDFTGVGGTFTINGNGGGDTLTVNGTTGADAFTATDTQVTIAGLLPVTYGAIPSVVLSGGAGADSFTVTPSDAVVFSVDGGDPIGTGDTLSLVTGANPITFNPGPQADQGSITVGANQPVSYIHIEGVTATSTGGPLIINGTSGPDTITIIGTGTHNFTVNVNDGPTITYIGVPIINVAAGAGGDEIDVYPFYGGAGWDEAVNIDGGTPTLASGGDHLLVAGSPASENVVYTPSAGTLSINGGAATGSLFTITNIESFDYDGGGGNDHLTVTSPVGPNTVTVTAGSKSDSGTVSVDSFLALGFGNLGLGALLDLNDAGPAVVDTLHYIGAAVSNAFTVANNGTITLNSQIAVLAEPGSFQEVVLDGQSQQAILNLPGGINPYVGGAGIPGINLFGNAQSVVNLSTSAAGGQTINVDALAGLITGFGGSIQTGQLSQLNITDSASTAANSFNVTGLGLGDLYATIKVVGSTTVQDTLTFSGTGGNDTLDIGAGGLITALGVGGSVLGILRVSNISGGLFEGPSGGSDVTQVDGTPANDIITLLGSSGAPFNLPSIQINSDTPVLLKAGAASTVLVNGFAGNDQLIVDSTVAPFTIPVTFDGGTGNDTLILKGGTATSDTYTVGPDPGSGSSVLTFAGGTESVFFTNLEPVIDSVAGPLVVNGNGASNAISYTQGSVAANGLVSIDSFETIEFTAKTTLTLNGGGGNDDFSIHNGATPTGLTGITVNGGDPTTQDHLTVDGTVGNNAITYTLSGPDAGNVAITGLPTVTFNGVSAVSVDGQGGTDNLTIVTAAGFDKSTLTPGTSIDSGHFDFTAINNPVSQASLDFSRLGANGSITLTNGPGTRVDSFVYNGTAGTDVFGVTASGDVTLNSQITVHTPGVAFLTLNGFSGANIYNLVAGHPFTTILVAGGGGGNNDQVNIRGAIGATETVLVTPSANIAGAADITGLGGIISASNVTAVQYTGLGTNDTLTVFTAGGDDQVTVSRGIGVDQVVTNIFPAIQFTGLNTFNLDLGQGVNTATFVTAGLAGALPGNYHLLGHASDTLVIQGRDGAADSFTVTHPATGSVAVTDAAAPGVTVTETTGALGALHLNTLGGNDQVTVNVGPQSDVIGVPILFDGGTGFDTLTVTGTPATTVAQVTYTVNPLENGGSLAYTDGGGATLMSISFLNLEPVFDFVPATLVVNGTAANNFISYTQGSVPANGLVTVDNNESIEFNNKTTLTLNGLGGQDVISINNPLVPTGLTGIIVNGGTLTDGDRLIVNGTPATDAIGYLPGGPGFGSVTVNALPAVQFATISAVTIDGRGGNDALTITTVNGSDQVTLTPGTAIDAGHIDITANLNPVSEPSLDYSNLGALGSLTLVSGVGIREDAFVYNGTAGNDVFQVQPNGDVLLNNQLVVHTPGDAFLTLNGFAGSDIFNISGSLPFSHTFVVGGNVADNDLVKLSGAAGPVTVQPNSGNPDSTDVIGVGGIITTSGVAAIRYTGTGGDSLTVITGAGNDTATVSAGQGYDRVDSSSLPEVQFTGLQIFTLDMGAGQNTGTFVTAGLHGAPPANYHFTGHATDVLVIQGQDGAADNYTVTHPAAGSVAIVDNSAAGGGVTVTETTGKLGALHINTLGGDDQVTVDVGGASNVIGVPILYDGGTGSDKLTVTGSPATTVSQLTYSVNPLEDGGRLAYTDAGGATLMLIDFLHLEPVFDFVPVASLVVNATSADNAINYTTGSVAADGLVSVDNNETLEFSNKTTLTLNGLGGNDTINIRNSFVPTGLTAINVNGGDPTETDTLIVNGTTAQDTVSYAPAGFDAGVVTVTGLPVVNFASTESLIYNGQGGNDLMTITTPAGSQVVQMFPGNTTDSAQVALHDAGGITYTAFSFNNVGATGQLTIADISGNRVDALIYSGRNFTNEIDVFTVTTAVNPAGQVTLNAPASGGGQALQIPVNTPGILNLTLAGLGDDDVFNLTGTAIYNSVLIDGGDSSGSDIANLNGDGTAVNVTIGAVNGAALITGGALGTVTLAATEVLNLNAAAGDISIFGTPGPNAFDVTPTGPNTATLFAVGFNPVVNTNNTGLLTFVEGTANDGDTLTVHGTSQDDTINITRGADTTVAVNALKVVHVNTPDIEALVVDGGLGGDFFNVFGGGGPRLTVDGQQPLSNPQADTVDVHGIGGGADAFTVTQGETSDSGSIELANSNGDDVTQFQGMENVIIDGGGGAPGDSATFIANNADNDIVITILGGDKASLSLDAQPVVNLVGFGPGSSITVDSLAGDDDISVVIATPNDSNFTHLFIDAGQPTASDKLIVNGVPQHDDSLQFQPTALGTGEIFDNSLAFPTIDFTDLEHLYIVGQSGAEHDNYLENFATGDNTIEVAPGLTPDTGVVTGFVFGATGNFDFVPTVYSGIFGILKLPNSVPQPGNQTLIVDGTSGDDTFNFGSTGPLAPTFPSIVLDTGANPHTPIYFSNGISRVILRGMDGNDTFNLDFDPGNSSPPVHIVVEGGGTSTGTDVINHISVPNASTTINLNDGTILSTAANVVEFSGIAQINQISSGNASTLAVVGTSGPDTFVYSPLAPDQGLVNVPSQSLGISFKGITGNFTLEPGDGGDTITVSGTPTADTFNIVRGAQTQVQVNNWKTVIIDTITAEAIIADGGLGDDSFTVSGVDGSQAASHGVLTILGGGSGPIGDTLTVNPASGTTTVAQGATPDGGTISSPQSASITFGGLELVTIHGANPLIDQLIVTGSQGNDSITVLNNASGNQVLVNARTPISFNNYFTLTVDGQAGDDFVSVSPSGIALNSINIIGGDPTASDTLLVNGTPGKDVIGFNPLSAGAGNITIAGLPTVNFNTTEHVEINGLGGGDALTITTPAGAQDITYTAGATSDSGAVQIGSLVGMNFLQLGASAAIVIADISGNRVDNLYYAGTGGDDTFSFNNGVVTLNNQLAPSMPGVANLILQGLEGNDTFNVVGSGPFTSLTLQGGGPTDADVANLSGDGTNATVNVGTLVTGVTGAGLGNVFASGVEIINLAAGAGAIGIQGSGNGDNIQVTPTGTNTASITVAGSATTVNTTNTGALVITPAGGVDSVSISGNIAANNIAVTLGATTTVAVDGLKVIGVTALGTELLSLAGLGGDDHITITGSGGPSTLIDAGDGNDTVNASGAGDALTILGGTGNDTLTGGTGADTILGGAGDDTITGGPGKDQMFGEDGSDTFIWNPGDGSDVIEGGDGNNVLTFNGATVAEVFGLAANGTRLSLTRDVGGVTLDMAGVQQINLNTGGGADTLNIGDLTTTDLRVLNVDLGSSHGAGDKITIQGRNVSDNLSITSSGPGALDVTGFAYSLHFGNAATVDTVTVKGNAGDDTITAVPGVEAIAAIILDGGLGNDTLAGSGTLLGGDGNDVLRGGAGPNHLDGGAGDDTIFAGPGNDTLIGGDGNDLFVGGPGNSTFDGGAGFDTILVQGSANGPNTIVLSQPDAHTLNYSINGSNITDAITAVEGVSVNGGSGDDVFKVTQSDSLTASPADSLRFTINGGGAVVGDRLVVVDDGLGDTVIQRLSAVSGNGSISVGALAPVLYNGIQFVQPQTGGTDGAGQLLVFHTDTFEPNDSVQNAAHLGAGLALNVVGASIDPGPNLVVGAPQDADYFRVETLIDGKLNFNVYFDQLGTLSNGRAGLPGNGDLNIQVLDASGNVKMSGTASSFGETAGFFAHQGEIFYLKVTGASPDAINSFSATITDTPLPPFTGGGGGGGGGSGTGSALAFSAAVNYPTPPKTRGLALADINHDGTLDLVSVSSKTDTVNVQLGRGDGTFFNPVTFPAGGRFPIALSLVDLNNDGNLDVVTVTKNSSVVSVLLGDGTGHFSSPSANKIPGMSGPISIRTADLDGDGNQDVVTVNATTKNITVLRGDGTGHFFPAMNFATHGKNPRDIALGDFDGDGFVDAVVANSASHNISYLPGLPGATFGPAVLFRTEGGKPVALTVGDFNSDGHLDVAVANNGAKFISVLIGSGLGGSLEFRSQIQVDYPTRSRPQAISVGDFNYDGKLDLVVSNLYGHDISVLLGNDNGTFSAPYDFTTGHHGRRNPQSIMVADINGDGLDDLLISNPGTGDISVLLRNSTV